MVQINKEFKTLNDQIKLLKDRKLIINDEEIAKKTLLEKSYFDLINGFETILLDDPKGETKSYSDKSLSDFINLYKFDKDLSSLILKTIDELEIKLKTSLAYHFCEIHCNNFENTYNYMDISNYSIPDRTDGPIRITKYFRKHKLFKKTYIYDDENNLNYAEFCKKKYDFINTYENPPFWIAIKTLMLNDILILMYGLEKDIFDQILLDFGYSANEKKDFLNSLEIIIALRNHCAHFQLVNRFRTDSKIKISYSLIRKLGLNCINRQYRIKLYDTLLVLGRYSNIDNIKEHIVSYWTANSNDDKGYINKGLFYRMGNENLDNWKSI